jgi:predicted Zn-dependent protease
MNRFLPALFLCLPWLALGGCAVNPATGQESFTAFMSPQEELKVGRDEHPKILKQFGGAYDDPNLGAYIAGITQALTRVTETPKLAFTVTVLNDDEINAFALPGGYVYITRGILALADNEAEVAGVLAHEIGHVVARHTAQRYSQAMTANLGLTILGVLGSAYGVPRGVGDLASFGAQAYLQSFSREQELEADMLGVRYMTRVGYDPNALTSFFRKLQAHTRLKAAEAGKTDGGDGHNIMSTHPRTADRITQAIRLAKVTRVANPWLGRDTYLANIDGMTFGDDPSQGIRRGRVFSHPGLRFAFKVPPDFTIFNSPEQVVARGPGGAVVAFDMADKKTARRARGMQAYLVRGWGAKLSLTGVETLNVNGMEAATGQARAQTRKGPRDLRLVAIRGGPDRIFRFLFLTPANLTARLGTELRKTTYSFRRLSEGEARSIRPLRLKVVTVRSGHSPRSLAARMPFPRFRLEWFETLNGLKRGQPLFAGQKVKIVIK